MKIYTYKFSGTENLPQEGTGYLYDKKGGFFFKFNFKILKFRKSGGRSAGNDRVRC